MNEITNPQNTEIIEVQEMTVKNRLEIIEEGIRKKYLARLTEMQIAPIGNLIPLEEDLIVRPRACFHCGVFR